MASALVARDFGPQLRGLAAKYAAYASPESRRLAEELRAFVDQAEAAGRDYAAAKERARLDALEEGAVQGGDRPGGEVTVREAAALLGTSPRWVRRLLDRGPEAGGLRGRKVGRRWLVDEVDLAGCAARRAGPGRS